MATLQKRSFDAPDERRTPPHAEIAFVKFGDRTVARITYFPGFRWTTDMRPSAGTDLCQGNHFTYAVSGRCGVAMADGAQVEFGPGDIGTIPPGHDAWVIGDEPFVTIDFGGAARPE